MSIAQIEERQGFLFSEPAITQTGVWCTLNDGINPAEWAGLCREIGKLTPRQFRLVQKKIQPDPDSIISRIKRLFTFNQSEVDSLPAVSIGPSGIGGRFQKEY